MIGFPYYSNLIIGHGTQDLYQDILVSSQSTHGVVQFFGIKLGQRGHQSHY